MNHLLDSIKILIIGSVIIGGLLLLMGLAVNPIVIVGLIAAFLVCLLLDVISRVFFPVTDREDHIHDGCCPACRHDLSNIGIGQTSCPNCGETIPAPLRKWGSH